MNVLTQPLLFRDLQGATPPIWYFGTAYQFSNALSAASKGITYTGAAFKLPTSLTVSLTTSAGTPAPVMTVTVTSASQGDLVTTQTLAASTTVAKTITLPDDATGLDIRLGSAAVPYAGTVAVTMTPVSAVDRVYSPNLIGRTSTAYVSAYQRGRVNVSRMYANETRQMVADFNGALNNDRALASATWQTWGQSSIKLESPTITAKQTGVRIACGYSGRVVVKCSVTLDNGGILVQQFTVDVLAQPYYTGDSYSFPGPQSLTVNS